MSHGKIAAMPKATTICRSICHSSNRKLRGNPALPLETAETVTVKSQPPWRCTLAAARLARLSAQLTNLQGCNTINLDVEMSRPSWNAYENSGRGIRRKVTGIDGVDGSELLDRSAVNVALQDVFKRRSCGFDAKL